MAASKARPETAAEIREAFLRFFEERGHRRVDSHSLLPPADPTLLFINAGMVQFKDYFTGARPAPYDAATTTQKCLRVSGKHNDLENVGRTRRHQTLFEMLGNFSFGGYFKRGAIEYGWSFLSDVLGLDKGRLIVTYFEGNAAVPADTEARDLWAEISGLPADRIIAMTEKDNFWAMGESGPCGPCSEIYFDLWPEQGESTFPEDEARYMEIWNLVFMQYDRQFDGTLMPLPAPAVDTGMGLERVTSVVQKTPSNYGTDLLRGLIHEVELLSDKRYGGRFDPEGNQSHVAEVEQDVAMRVVADHARATAFLIAEAIFPDNEGRGYVLRRIMRRAIRFGRKLGLEEPFLYKICDHVVDGMSDVFPELGQHREVMGRVVRQEEERFSRTLAEGERLIAQALDRVEAEGGKRLLDGETVFLLYDSNGFPTDLTALIAAERGFEVDMAGFTVAMNRQRQRGRASWQGAQTDSLKLAVALVSAGLTTRFFGYLTDEVLGAEVLAILDGGEHRGAADAGDTVEVLLDRTPFYGEGGGQVGDIGSLAWNDMTTVADRAVVVATSKPLDEVFLHTVRVETGRLQVGSRVDAVVDPAHRAGVKAHHSATHLLHKALRDVLGTHVQQRGSLVERDRLRFDFSHFAAMTPEQVAEVERLTNAMILENEATDAEICTIDEAKKRGALMFFGDKYGDEVRVMKISESVELCGGTHVERTGDIGLVKVVSESGVSSGVRRLEAECHLALLDRVQWVSEQLERVAGRFNAKLTDADDRVGQALDNLKRLERENKTLRQQLVLAQAAGPAAEGDDGAERRSFGECTAVARVVEGVGGKDLRVLGDQMRDQLGRGAALLISKNDGGKVALLVAVSKAESDQMHAGKTVQAIAPLVGGRGGGRPDFAQAGGGDPSGIDKAVKAFFEAASSAFSA